MTRSEFLRACDKPALLDVERSERSDSGRAKFCPSALIRRVRCLHLARNLFGKHERRRQPRAQSFAAAIAALHARRMSKQKSASWRVHTLSPACRRHVGWSQARKPARRAGGGAVGCMRALNSR